VYKRQVLALVIEGDDEVARHRVDVVAIPARYAITYRTLARDLSSPG